MPSIDGEDDPFAEFMQPPPNETPAQMTVRQAREEDERRANELIEEDIRRQKSQAKKEKDIIRVLLLGQAESGKSTTLKNFRMQYDGEAWERERAGWRAVVQLNIVRAIITILAVVETELNGQIPYPDYTSPDETVSPRFTDHHQLLMIRLAPLRGVETDLKRRLGSGTEPPAPYLPMSATPFETPTVQTGSVVKRKKEFSVRSWKDVVDPDKRRYQSTDGEGGIDSATLTIAGCKDDMKALVEDEAVKAALDRRKIMLADCALFFLRDLDRIATRNYMASDDDIVRARLRTVGIQEYRIRVKPKSWEAHLTEGAWEWRMYDVGGCRTARHAWLPFFENTNVILFLCPISCFDETLEEDPRVNRLEDSFILWKSICSSPLLEKSQLILFMNKCDLLSSKLRRVKVKDYVSSYGDRPNETPAVAQYFQTKFRDAMKKLSPNPRPAYCHLTTVTDTTATAKTLESVRDGVLRNSLGELM